MAKAKDVQQQITDKIVTALESGDLPPWRMPWQCVGGSMGGMPSNWSTKNGYNGINILILWAEQIEKDYSFDYWMTYKQAQAMGGQVRKGERGTQIIKYGTFEKENDKGETDTLSYAKAYAVFNLAQIDGIELPGSKPVLSPNWSAHDYAEKLVYQSGAQVQHGGDRAFYRRSENHIQMPERGQFARASDYYATLLHELTHWTGGTAQLDRMPAINAKFEESRQRYAFEELVAEIGSCFLMAECGLYDGELGQHASYIDSWLSLLRKDPRHVVKAASMASKAHAYVMERMSADSKAA